jgi:hypothetical protein
MIALLAANPYLGIEAPDMDKVYMLFAAIVIVFMVMGIVRSLGRVRERKKEEQSAWKTYRKMAKARGLTPIEVEVLGRTAAYAQVKRPAQLLSTIQLFDRSVAQLTEAGKATSSDQNHLDAVRKKLVAKAEVWDRRRNRRQLERAKINLPIQFFCVAQDRVDEKVKIAKLREGEREEERIEAVWGGLVEGIEPHMGYIIDISAGGAALSTQENLNIQGADYIQCIRMGEDMALDLDGLLGQIVAVAPKEKEEESLVLHMSFFPYAQEKRREVISFVYAVEAGTAPTDQVQGTDGKLRDSSETANPSTPSTQ